MTNKELSHCEEPPFSVIARSITTRQSLRYAQLRDRRAALAMTKKHIFYCGEQSDSAIPICYNLSMETLRKTILFGDIDRVSISPERHRSFIIESILEFGDINDLRWMKKNFISPEIRHTVHKSRYLSLRSLAYCEATGFVSESFRKL